ncbi:cytochrome c [Maribius pontilimi]|uniref:Cytochrome c n=1 Tax=Palleronia pontilimi TaxID=1964209 RepID=A0A934IKB6_9RHOB|nr:cytochrome c [Palleronia pontilimi]MBJ3764546.1 cytochrome c [Palleronia pontilimi]
MACIRRGLLGGVIAIALPAVQVAAEDLGKQIFLEGSGDMPACAVCHMLSDAGSEGEIGPNLDKLMPDEARVRIAVHDGVGVMPAFGEALTEAQIDAVARYVASVAGQ